MSDGELHQREAAATPTETRELDAPATATGLYEGFEGYRSSTEDDYSRVLTRGVVIPDTNVLLNLYRYNSQARSDLLAVLTRLGDRLWVPRQVVAEFWKNRERALGDPEEAAERALDALSTQESASTQALRSWANRVALDGARLEALQGDLEATFATLRDAISESLESDSMSRAADTNSDSVLGSLAGVLANRVGPALPSTDIEAVRVEGRRRLDAGIPPGYMDAAKTRKDDPDAGIGDYLLWEQVLREAARRNVDVLIVTGDVKEDWWRRVEGEIRGPRVELVEELRSRAGVKLFMLRPESLLIHARRVLDVEVRDESLQDVERVDRFVAGRDLGGWTHQAAQQLLSRLDSEAPVQAEAIREAAVEGGFVGRDVVYALGGYEDTRTLRGFTRPANRIAQDLRDRGLIPDTAPDPLEAVYDPTFSWVLARGFRIPPQLADVLQSEVEGS